MAAKNFRTELFPEYKANRRKPAKPRVTVRTLAIDGGWRTYVCSAKAPTTIASIFDICSPMHKEDAAQVQHLGAIAWAKSQGWIVASNELLTKEESIKAQLSPASPQIRLYEPYWAPDVVPTFKVPENQETLLGGAKQ